MDFAFENKCSYRNIISTATLLSKYKQIEGNTTERGRHSDNVRRGPRKSWSQSTSQNLEEFCPADCPKTIRLIHAGKEGDTLKIIRILSASTFFRSCSSFFKSEILAERFRRISRSCAQQIEYHDNERSRTEKFRTSPEDSRTEKFISTSSFSSEAPFESSSAFVASFEST